MKREKINDKKPWSIEQHGIAVRSDDGEAGVFGAL